MDSLPRFSNMEGVILKLLRGHHERYGLELVKMSDGLLKRAIYVLLSRLEEKGMVASRLDTQVQDDKFVIPRRMYRITGLGAKAFNALEAANMMYFGTAPSGA